MPVALYHTTLTLLANRAACEGFPAEGGMILCYERPDPGQGRGQAVVEIRLDAPADEVLAYAVMTGGGELWPGAYLIPAGMLNANGRSRMLSEAERRLWAEGYSPEITPRRAAAENKLCPGNTPADLPAGGQVRTEGDPVPIITMLNQKGGVGKTSTCHHLAGTLALMGKRILLCDNDPQSSLSQGFWGPAAVRALDPAETIASLYAGDEPYPEQVIKPTGIPGIDILPGSKRATRFNVPEPQEASEEVQWCLRRFLDEVRDRYDVVLVDCPPNLHACSWASLLASDHIIIPLKPEDYGAQGIIDVQESVAMVQAGPNPALGLLGFLLQMVSPRKKVHQLFEETLRERFGTDVFATRVEEAVDYVEALNQRKPVAQFKLKSAAARTMKALAEELLARVAAVSVAGSEAA